MAKSLGKAGSLERRRWQESRDWPAGPTTASAFMDWPAHLAATLKLDPAACNRLCVVFHRRIRLLTDFSGIGGAEQFMRDATDALQQGGVSMPMEAIEEYRACEINKSCQRILLDREPGPTHVFPDIMDYMPKKSIQQLATMHPGKGASDESMIQFHRRVLCYMLRRRSILFGPDSKSKCLKHPDMLCKHAPAYEDDDGQRIPTFAMAGSSCQPYSSSGKRKQHADQRIMPALIWQCQRKRAQDDFVGLENSPLYPIKDFSNFMSPTHQMISMVVGPEDPNIQSIFLWKIVD